MMKKAKTPVRITVFLLILVILVQCGVQYVFRNSDYRIPQMVKGIKKEPAGSLDVVFVGASNIYAYWNSMIAYEEYGITSWTYAIPGLPALALKNMIAEARKSHPDALYVVGLNGFKNTRFKESYIHLAADYIPLSRNKIDLVNKMCDAWEVPLSQRIEYVLPLIRFHSGWSELDEKDFYHPLEDFKSAQHNPAFLLRSIDQSSYYVETERREPLTDPMQVVLDDLLDYCREEDLNVLFAALPQALDNEDRAGLLNYVCDYVADQGFDVLNQTRETDRIGLDVRTDMKDKIHTNIHGALKYTMYMGGILTERYTFKDARKDERSESWNASLSEYRKIVDPLFFPFETDGSLRDPALQPPEEQEAEAEGKGISVSFSSVPGADGYEIYRRGTAKDENNIPTEYWTLVQTVPDDGRTDSYYIFDGKEIEPEETFEYTVVPYRTGEDGRVYGSFHYNGKSVEALPEEQDSDEGEESDSLRAYGTAVIKGGQ